MRNVFDQYSQPENRLTHAVAVCLNEDRDLLRQFLKWINVDITVPTSRLEIIEQRLPGDPPEAEDETEHKGLPDVVIHHSNEWALLIESKIQAALTDDQLARHERSLRRRDFEQVHRLALTKSGVRVPPKTIALCWSALYEWLGGKTKRSEWALRLRDYLRAAEVRLSREGYLTEGTLTMFDGFPFSKANPYTYGEAKRLLKLALKELRSDRSLLKLGIDAEAPGRGAIKGREASAVWDFLSLVDRPKDGAFTGYPHLTLAIHADQLETAVTIPNGVTRSVRHRLRSLGPDGLSALNRSILQRARDLLARGAQFEAYALQRHYASQSAAASVDARCTFRLETSQARGKGGVKCQPEWAELFATLLRTKRSNIQFGYTMRLPWGTKGLDRRESLRLIADGWCAMKPLLDVIRGKWLAKA